MLVPKTVASTAILLTLLLAAPLDAEAMRCGNRLVSTHDSRAKVVAICGQPDDVESHTVYRTAGPLQYDLFARHRSYVVRGSFFGPQIEIPVHVEQWVYNFGANRLMQRVTFADGQVKRIESLGYGYDASEPQGTEGWALGDEAWPNSTAARRGEDAPWGLHDTSADRPEATRPLQPANEQPWGGIPVEPGPEFAN